MKACLLLLSVLSCVVLGSHIDDVNGELSNFSFDKVVFRLQKDCSLDRIPDVRIIWCGIHFQVKFFLDNEAVKYPALSIFLSGKQNNISYLFFILEGEPRFELLKAGEVVDTVRVGRYDLASLVRLLKEFGLKRDDSWTWEKKRAEIELEKAFKEAQFTGQREEL